MLYECAGARNSMAYGKFQTSGAGRATLGVPLGRSARLATSCKCYHRSTLRKGGDMEGRNTIFVISLNMLCNAAVSPFHVAWKARFQDHEICRVQDYGLCKHMITMDVP